VPLSGEAQSEKSSTPFVALAIATAGGAGYVPIAPGTAGTAVGLLLWWLLPQSPVLHIVLIVTMFILGSWSGTVAERHFHKTDPGHVVLDEVMGMFVTLLMNPVGWKGALVGFVLFRAFDVVKPPPTNWFERLPGGSGIMADDAMAGVYANLALRLIIRLVRAYR
jgi:phosphatidylglycerophosphatase A